MDIWSKFVQSKDTPAVYFFFAFIRSICNGNALTSGLFRSVRPNHHFEKLKFFFGANFWGGNKKVSQKPKSKLSKTKTNSHEPNAVCSNCISEQKRKNKQKPIEKNKKKEKK